MLGVVGGITCTCSLWRAIFVKTEVEGVIDIQEIIAVVVIIFL